MQAKICCFTGHRHIDDMAATTAALRRTVRSLAEQGYTVYRAGGAMGFDMLAALCVLELRQELGLRLELYLPCRDQADRWNNHQKSFYHHVLEEADSVTYVSQAYTPYCMFARNRRLVDGADLCVAYLKHSEGGTAYTVNYANQKKVEVINIA